MYVAITHLLPRLEFGWRQFFFWMFLAFLAGCVFTTILFTTNWFQTLADAIYRAISGQP